MRKNLYILSFIFIGISNIYAIENPIPPPRVFSNNNNPPPPQNYGNGFNSYQFGMMQGGGLVYPYESINGGQNTTNQSNEKSNITYQNSMEYTQTQYQNLQ